METWKIIHISEFQNLVVPALTDTSNILRATNPLICFKEWQHQEIPEFFH